MIWHPLKGSEGRYLINEGGEVFSNITNKVLSPKNSKGYDAVNISLYGDPIKEHKIHRLVAIQFLQNFDSLPQVNHKNGNKRDNRLSNLEWCTASHNSLHAHKTGLAKSNRPWLGKFGPENFASIPVVQLDLNGNFISQYDSSTRASQITGISRQGISRCCVGTRKTSGGFKWKHKEDFLKTTNSK